MAAESGLKRRRVFYVLDSLDDDDVGEHVATLLGRLFRSRFEPRVVTLRDEGPLAERMRDMRVTLHTLPGGGVLDPVLAVPRLRKMLAGLEADLVHAFHHVSGAVSELAAPRGVPVVRYVSELTSASDPPAARLVGAMEALAASHRNVRFVVGSQEAQARVAEYYAVPSVDIVAECLDVAAVRAEAGTVPAADARVRLGLAEGEAAVACITDFEDEAFTETLLGAFSVARLERPGLRLFIRGAGPAENRARWRAEELRLGDGVVFLRDPGVFPDVLAAAEVVVDTSTWPGPSRAGLKIAALGLPVLRWREGSPPERLATELLNATGDPRYREDLRDASAELVEACDVGGVVQQWTSLYENAADGAMRED